MTGLVAELSAIAKTAFAAEGLPEALGQVQASDRPDLAQFQCNGALAAAKIAKTNPRAIAEKIAARLRTDPIFAKATTEVLVGEAMSIVDGLIDGHLKPSDRHSPFFQIPFFRTNFWRAAVSSASLA